MRRSDDTVIDARFDEGSHHHGFARGVVGMTSRENGTRRVSQQRMSTPLSALRSNTPANRSGRHIQSGRRPCTVGETGLKQRTILEALGYELRCAANTLGQQFQKGVGGELNLTRMECALLSLLAALGPSTPAKACKILAVRPPNIVSVAQTLVDRGLVLRLRNPRDRRSVVLAATEAGHDVETQARVRIREMERHTFRNLTTDQQARLIELLHALHHGTGEGDWGA